MIRRDTALIQTGLVAFAALLVVITGLFSGCARLSPDRTTSTLLPTTSPIGTELPVETSPPTPTELISTPGLVSLRIWVPPEFDPAAGTPAGDLLQARLDEFIRQRPGVEVQVRVKAIAGSGGMLDSLSTTRAAAPLAMPDLVALPRELLEVAALKGLLRPINDLTDILDAPDWYDYARQLSRLQGSTFGLPFAGDALVLIYRPETIPSPPADWAATLELRAPLVFPAADPLALFTIAQYQAVGGAIRDAEGRPYLDASQLTSVLAFYMQAEQNGLMPFWLTQLQSDEQVWDAFLDKRSDLAITWLSNHLAAILSTTEEPPDAAFAPLPTPDGVPFTLATGWVWALATLNQDRRILSLELAEFLCEANFLAQWTETTGYLPPRSNALGAWSNVDIQPLLSQVARSAVLYPSADISTPLGASLQPAVVQILKDQTDAATAAGEAAKSLSSDYSSSEP
jgi:multiple sugar transport system substrate-binding protein